jgi:hypothetical protein
MTVAAIERPSQTLRDMRNALREGCLNLIEGGFRLSEDLLPALSGFIASLSQD